MPWHAGGSDQGEGDGSAWERPKAMAQRQLRVATTHREEIELHPLSECYFRG